MAGKYKSKKAYPWKDNHETDYVLFGYTDSYNNFYTPYTSGGWTRVGDGYGDFGKCSYLVY